MALALVVTLGVSLLGPSSALAAETGQREHVLKFSFSVDVKGSGKTKVAEPTALAVNETSGDVYVLERTHKAIYQFKITGGGGGAELVREFSTAVASPVAVAVDNSTATADESKGDVYVANGSGAILKFTSEGTLIAKFKAKGGAPITGLAVDGAGNLIASESDGFIARFDNAPGGNAFISHTETGLGAEGTRLGLALDSAGNYYVGSRGISSETTETNLFNEMAHEWELLNPEGPAFQVIAKLEAGTGKILVPALANEMTSAVAVNSLGSVEYPAERNDVYIVNLAGSAAGKSSTLTELAGEGASPGEPGPVLQRIELPANGKGESDGVGVALDSSTGAVYVLDAVAAKVDVYQLAPAGAPRVSGLSASSSAGAWTLKAQVNPTGADTHYHFEYGTQSCASGPSACTSTASTDLGSGFGVHPVSQGLTGLEAGRVYHYRIVAENSFGTVQSVERTFSTAASGAGLPDGRAWELVSPPKKNGAEPEAISREGGQIQAAAAGGVLTYIANGPFFGETPEGNQSPLVTQFLATRGPGGWSSRDINAAATAATGVIVGHPPLYQFFSPNLSLALVQPSPGVPGSGRLAQPPLSPAETHQKTIYLRDNQPLAPEAAQAGNFEKARENGIENKNPGFLALVNDENAKVAFGSTEFGGGIEEGLEFSGATTDLSHVVFRSLTAAPGLYEWVGQHQPIQRVSVLPGPSATLEPGGVLGLAEGRDPKHAISSDGSRVIWSSREKHLYMRDTSAQETVQLDAFQGVPEAGEPTAYFQTASADGSKVFFTDTQRLTADSKAVQQSPDLYVYEVSPGHPLSGTLRDLTATAGASVVVDAGGGVLGASEDGSYVYFVANGVLAAGASQGHCPLAVQPRPAGTTCNLYMRHFNGSGWEASKLIATLSSEDDPDWGHQAEGNLSYQTSRVSPKGRYLAFMSNRNLTGYEPIDAVSGKRDEEVYLYDAASAGLVCASCNPTGAAPFGVHDVGNNASGESPEGIGLVVDRPQTWAEAAKNSLADHWLAGSVPGWTALSVKTALYQSRYLSDSGRLFFNSPDHLVPAATGTKEKVYEYEPGSVGGCASEGGCVSLISGGDAEHEAAFLDASENGNDVFFLSAQQLVPNPESNFSIYDARVCEAASPCITGSAATTATCDEETVACKGSPAPFSGGGGAPGSAMTSGPGNVLASPQIGVLPAKVVKAKTLTRAQKLALALKACRKIKKKSKRVACEKTARKHYGTTAKKKATHK